MLKRDQDTHAILLVLCTGAESAVESREYWLAEMNIAVVLKPFDIDHLEAMVQSALRPHDDRGVAASHAHAGKATIATAFTAHSRPFTATSTLPA